MRNNQSEMILILERIATALEVIVASLAQSQPQSLDSRDCTVTTPFPWERVSVRCRKYLRAAVIQNWMNQFHGRQWPLSCEDLVAIGCDELLIIRNFGPKSAKEIAFILDELGFKDWIATARIKPDFRNSTTPAN